MIHTHICHTLFAMASHDKSNPAERVRERLQRWKELTGQNQRDFAKSLGKSNIWLQKVLTGENHVRLKDLDAVAQTLRTTASELVRQEEGRYQLDLTPTEARIVERLRGQPDTLAGVAILLRIPMPSRLHVETADDESGNPAPRVKRA